MSTVFNNNDYNSNDGMMTYIWGPALWHSLHTISFNYPVNPTKEHQKHYEKFFKSLRHVLPCKYCRDNYVNNLKDLPITKAVLKNRESFSRWVYELHEKVNKNLGKKSDLTYEQVRNRYEHFRSRCLNNPKETKKEKGCTEALYGIKSKCVINIVPKEKKCNTFKMDSKCKIKK